MPKQLGFDLPSTPALGREDFLVAPSNALAVALIDTWPEWSAGKLVLTGPEGSGKTHLAQVWRGRSNAQVIEANALASADIPALAEQSVAVENVPEIAGHAASETALFHLHNLTLANGHTLLFTGRAPLASWPLDLPDLKSRLQGAATAKLDSPDDNLLSSVLAKLFDDRQIIPHPDVIPYLVKHMDRSFAAARDVVDALDTEAMARKQPITRPMAIEVLARTA